MGEQTEIIEVKRVHDNDKYVITRKIVEDVNGDELIKIYEDINKAEADIRKQLNEIPKQSEERV